MAGIVGALCRTVCSEHVLLQGGHDEGVSSLRGDNARDPGPGLLVRRDDLDDDAIAGTVVGVVVAVGLLAFCLYPVVVRYIRKRRRRLPFDAEAGDPDQDRQRSLGRGDPTSRRRRLSSTDSYRHKFEGTRGKQVTRGSLDVRPPRRDTQGSSAGHEWLQQSHDADGIFEEPEDDGEGSTDPIPNTDQYLYREGDVDTVIVPEQDSDGNDRPIVLKGTSADYYSPSIPSEAFGMFPPNETDAEPPIRPLSRTNSLKHNVMHMFRRKSTRDRTMSSHSSTHHSEDHGARDITHLQGATPMRIITSHDTVEEPITESPTETSMPALPAPAMASMSRGLSRRDSGRSPPPSTSQSPEHRFKSSPSPPANPAPGTVNPMDIMPATTDSELWHRTEQELFGASYGSSHEGASPPMPGQNPSFGPIISEPSPTSQHPRIPTQTFQSPTPTSSDTPHKQDSAEDGDVVMADTQYSQHFLHPAPHAGRHPSYPSDQSTPFPPLTSTTPSTQNTPSTQIDSPSPESSGSSDFRQSASPQPATEASSLKTEVYACDEPGCGQVFDQRHKLKHHRRYHSKEHKCPYAACGKGFGTKTHLQRHINDRHEKKKKYHCAVQGCDYSKEGGKAFPRKDNWKRHMTKIHNVDSGSLPEPLEIDQDMTGT